MDPTNSNMGDGNLDPAAFYDQLAPSYDVMTGFEARFEREKPAFQRIVTEYGIRSAIDAGSGSGFHALLLAQMGVHVTAADISAKMLDRVRDHAREMHLPIDLVQSSFQDLADSVHEKVDAVFCLGNSIPHLLNDEDVKGALTGFATVLKPGGVLVAQILNYGKILATRERIVGVQQRNDAMFIRFYDFIDPLVRFNILSLQQRGVVWKPALQSTLLRPLFREDLGQHLAAAGFEASDFFGTMSMDNYVLLESRDVVVVARKRP
jgi:glycine/sarcosine N-methyltransferase